MNLWVVMTLCLAKTPSGRELNNSYNFLNPSIC